LRTYAATKYRYRKPACRIEEMFHRLLQSFRFLAFILREVEVEPGVFPCPAKASPNSPFHLN
jgi:hypothetical protein